MILLSQLEKAFRQLYQNETSLKISNLPFFSLKLRYPLSSCQLFSLSLSVAVLKNFINVFSRASNISFTWAGLKFNFETMMLNLAFVNKKYIYFQILFKYFPFSFQNTSIHVECYIRMLN